MVRFLVVLLAGLVSPASAAGIGCDHRSLISHAPEVVEPCNEALAKPGLSNDDRAWLHFVRGRAFHRSARRDLAVQDYREALKLRPDFPDASISLANGLISDESLVILKDVIRRHPDNARAHATLSTFLDLMGDRIGTLSHRAEALRLDPNEPEALLRQASDLRLSGRLQQAIDTLDRLIGLDPEKANSDGWVDPEDGMGRDVQVFARVFRAQLNKALHRPEQARRDLDEAIARAGTWAQPSEELIRFFATYPGPEGEVDRVIATVLQLKPNSSTGLFSRGYRTFLKGDMKAARADFERSLAVFPGQATVWFYRALTLRAEERSDEAFADVEKALRLDWGMTRYLTPGMHRRGYWPSPKTPDDYSPAYADAVRACMVDPKCN